MTPSILLMLSVVASAASAASLSDPCGPDFGRITECPDRYMPSPVKSPPSQSDKAAIIGLINAAKTALLAEDAARADWAAAKFAFEIHKDRSAPEASRATQNYADRAKKLAAAKAATRAAYESAILKTAEVYQLKPPVADFSQDPALPHPWRGMNPWAPSFSTEEIRDSRTGMMRRRTPTEIDQERERLAQLTAESGMSAARRPQAGGTNRRTGQISLFALAFVDVNGDPDPDALAGMILHETVHWVDIVSVAGQVRAPAEAFRSEARAYDKQAQLYDSVGKADHAVVGRLISKRYSALAKEAAERRLTWDQAGVDPYFRRWLPGSVPGVSEPGGAEPGDPERDKVAGDESFLEGIDKLGDVSRQAREETRVRSDREQREREERRRREHEELLARLEAEDAAWRAAYRYIKTAAGLACADPEAFERESRGGGVIGVEIDHSRMSSYLYSDVNEVGWKSLGVKPNECQRDVIERIIQFPRPVDPAMIEAWARAYRDSHPSLLKRFVTSLSELFESRDEYRSENRGAESEPRAPREREDRGGRVGGGLNGPAYGQARGILSNGWRP